MKRILVPTDFSECAGRALEFAASLTKKVSGEIFLIHVHGETDDTLRTSGEWSSVKSAYAAEIPPMIGLLKETKILMEDLKKQEFLRGVPVHDNIEVGDAGIMIGEAAEKYNADIIIMGTNGAAGLKEFFMGSTAQKVVQHAERPVLAIKEKFTTEPKNIIFASDFKNEAENVFGFVSKFAKAFNAKLHLLEVVSTDKTENDLKSNNLRLNNIEYPVTFFKDKSNEEGILHYAQQINADIIAIGTHGRHGISRLFNPSVSEDLVNHSFCPVLTVNFKK